MKTVLLSLFLILTLNAADIKTTVIEHFKKKEYAPACHKAYPIIDQYIKDENFMTLYAFSCLYADYIDRLNLPIAKLKYTKEARANAAYFSVILMQKKLLIHAMIDGNDISGLKLPTTEHILSTVFDLYQQHAVSGQSAYEFTDTKDNRATYKLYSYSERNVHKMVIEEYYDKIMQHRHIYW